MQTLDISQVLEHLIAEEYTHIEYITIHTQLYQSDLSLSLIELQKGIETLFQESRKFISFSRFFESLSEVFLHLMVELFDGDKDKFVSQFSDFFWSWAEKFDWSVVDDIDIDIGSFAGNRGFFLFLLGYQKAKKIDFFCFTELFDLLEESMLSNLDLKKKIETKFRETLQDIDVNGIYEAAFGDGKFDPSTIATLQIWEEESFRVWLDDHTFDYHQTLTKQSMNSWIQTIKNTNTEFVQVKEKILNFLESYEPLENPFFGLFQDSSD
eukprot:TRINITY_DN6594_c0_g1_i1.p1 TRINITY_DN6594_c0_g1~~TRINITY_DN6594_c0_g1_i1.p1  ORF type:complete len:267 (+),score=55.11 TRINITY_DN6594_c0_g1_i1:140-940(+)